MSIIITLTLLKTEIYVQNYNLRHILCRLELLEPIMDGNLAAILNLPNFSYLHHTDCSKLLDYAYMGYKDSKMDKIVCVHILPSSGLFLHIRLSD